MTSPTRWPANWKLWTGLVAALVVIGLCGGVAITRLFPSNLIRSRLNSLTPGLATPIKVEEWRHATSFIYAEALAWPGLADSLTATPPEGWSAVAPTVATDEVQFRYPGFFNPLWAASAPVCLRSNDGKCHVWVFDDGRVLLRTRVGRLPLPREHFPASPPSP